MFKELEAAKQVLQTFSEVGAIARSPQADHDFQGLKQLYHKLEADVKTLEEKLGDGKIDGADFQAAVEVEEDLKALAQGVGTIGSLFGTEFSKVKARFGLGD